MTKKFNFLFILFYFQNMLSTSCSKFIKDILRKFENYCSKTEEDRLLVKQYIYFNILKN